MLVFVLSDCRMALALNGFVAANNIFKTARRCDVLDMPALRKASTASAFFVLIIMSDALSKMQPSCNNYKAEI